MIAGPFKGHMGAIFSVAFSPDGKCVVTGSQDKTIRIWDVKTGQIVAGPFEGHRETVFYVSFSLDNTQVISGSFSERIHI